MELDNVTHTQIHKISFSLEEKHFLQVYRVCLSGQNQQVSAGKVGCGAADGRSLREEELVSWMDSQWEAAKSRAKPACLGGGSTHH